MSHWQYQVPTDAYPPGHYANLAMSDEAFEKHLKVLERDKHVRYATPPRINDVDYNAYQDAKALSAVKRMLKGVPYGRTTIH